MNESIAYYRAMVILRTYPAKSLITVIHPVMKNNRVVMVLPVDKNRASAFQDLFRLFDHELSVNKLTQYVKICSCARDMLLKGQCTCSKNSIVMQHDISFYCQSLKSHQTAGVSP